MYKILLELPLFKGAAIDTLSRVLETTRFHFLKYLDSETIISKGDLCTHVNFIISGSVRTSIAAHDGRFCVSQTLSAPNVICPDNLFGKITRYPCSVVAQGPVGILQISKDDYVKILNFDPVFLFNFLNTLSADAQKSVDGALVLTRGSVEQCIAFCVIALTQSEATDIVLTCRQRDLCTLFGLQRSSLIATLDSMKSRGLIDYTPDEIRILSRRALHSLLS